MSFYPCNIGGGGGGGTAYNEELLATLTLPDPYTNVTFDFATALANWDSFAMKLEYNGDSYSPFAILANIDATFQQEVQFFHGSAWIKVLIDVMNNRVRTTASSYSPIPSNVTFKIAGTDLTSDSIIT